MNGPGDPPGGDPFGRPLPPGGINAGNRVMYPDLQGNLHPNPGEAITSNQRVESDLSRGASGGCGQDPGRIPDSSGR